ncbi:hypothetical protein BC941DRAFT_418819 [Chlamydoabsidia padenii]|nr:hypothetical protein BC941DRAFT_418819 [Chlamydoabsidia padenii]
MRDSIHHLIKIFVHRIPINQPFMLRSVSTNGYLSWRSNPKQQRNVNVHQHQQQNSDYNNSSSHSSPLVPNNHNSDLQQKAPVLFSTLPLDEMKSTNSYCVWKFSDNIGLLDLHLSPSRQAHYWTTSGVTKYVRCGSQLYLSPCLPPTLHNKDIILTRSNSTSISPTASSSTSLPLSGADTSVRRRGWDLYVEKAARVRSVEFLDKQHSEHESLQQHQWTVETPDLGLDLDDDFSTDGHLNVDIAIGRQKPILDQEIISLRQILYLCSVYNQIPRATSTQQTKRRSTNNNNNTSQLPPIIIPSPVPPAAAGVMAMFRDISNNDDDDKRAFSHPSANVGQSQSHYKQNKGTINDTTNLLVTSSSSSREPHATNTSGSTLPYYNLHTYTVLPPPLVTTSCITTTTLLPNSLSLSSSPCQQYFNPVLAKEHSLINGPEESYWIIELLSKDEDKRNTLITKGTSTDNRQKQSGKFTNGYSTNHPLPSGSQEPISTKRIGFRATQTMINKGRYATPSPLRLKMVMSSDTLRDDAKEEMLGGSNDEATLRRVQSFSSVHDHAQQHRQYLDRLGDLTDQDVYNGRNSNNNNNNNNNNDTTTETTPIHTGSTLVAVNSVTASSPSSLQQRIIPNGLLHLNATGDIQPYLQLYVAKQNSKTWSHIIKHSTLANIKRWLKTTT